MRQFISLLLFSLCMTLHAQQYDALLLVHFGTTHDDTRQKTIEAINEKARQQFSGMKVSDCISSGFVIKRLAARNIKKDTPTDALLKAQKCRQVTLVPLLFVAGDHATNDIAVEWKETLEKEGITVRVVMEGLGEVPEIQQLFF